MTLRPQEDKLAFDPATKGELKGKADKVYVDDEFTKVTTQLSHIEDLECDLSKFGIVPDTDDDFTSIIKTLVSQYKRFVIKGGHYNISEELLFKHGQVVRTIGKVTFEAKNFISPAGSAVVRVTNEGADYTNLPSLSADVLRGTRELTFNASHDLQVGDIICLYDNTDYSYSSARTYYKKGEFARVNIVVSSDTVALDSPIFDDYTSVGNVNFGVYKMNMGDFNIDGEFEVIQTKPGNYSGLVLERIKNGYYPKISAYANNGSVKGFVLDQSYNVKVDGTFVQQRDSGLGIDYGFSIVNCQHVYGTVYAVSSQHALTTGGMNGVGAIVNRDVQLKGVAKAPVSSYAIGLHGNTDLFYFDGNVFGGIMTAGENTKFRGTVTASENNGVCVAFNEVKSFNHDISGLVCKSKMNPAPKGIVDFGGTGTAEVNNMLGGVLKMQGIVIDAPEANAGIVIRTRNTNVESSSERIIDLSGANINVKNGLGTSSLAYRILDSSGLKNFSFVNAKGVRYKADTTIVTQADSASYESIKGNVTKTLSIGVSFVLQTVTFDKPFPAGYTPTTTASLRIRTLPDGKRVYISVSNSSSTGFTATIYSADGTNFSAETSVVFDYVAQ